MIWVNIRITEQDYNVNHSARSSELNWELCQLRVCSKLMRIVDCSNWISHIAVKIPHNVSSWSSSLSRFRGFVREIMLSFANVRNDARWFTLGFTITGNESGMMGTSYESPGLNWNGMMPGRKFYLIFIYNIIQVFKTVYIQSSEAYFEHSSSWALRGWKSLHVGWNFNF